MSDNRYMSTSSSLAAREEASRQILNNMGGIGGNGNNIGSNGGNAGGNGNRYSLSPFSMRFQRGDNSMNGGGSSYGYNTNSGGYHGNGIKTVDTLKSQYGQNNSRNEQDNVRKNSIFQSIVSLPLPNGSGNNSNSSNNSDNNNNSSSNVRTHNQSVEIPVQFSGSANPSPPNKLTVVLPKPSHPSIVSTSPKNLHTPSPRNRVTPTGTGNGRMFPKFNITKPNHSNGRPTTVTSAATTDIASTSPYKSVLKTKEMVNAQAGGRGNTFGAYVVHQVSSLFGMKKNGVTPPDAARMHDPAVYSNSPHLKNVKTGLGLVRKCSMNNNNSSSNTNNPNTTTTHKNTNRTVAHQKKEIRWDECIVRVAQIPALETDGKRPLVVQKINHLAKQNHLSTSTTSTSAILNLPVILDTTEYAQVEDGELVLEQGILQYQYAPAQLHLEDGDETAGGLYGTIDDEHETNNLHTQFDISPYLTNNTSKRRGKQIALSGCTKQPALVESNAVAVPLQYLVFASPEYLRVCKGREEDGEILGVHTIYDLAHYRWFELARRMVAMAGTRLDLRAMDSDQAVSTKNELASLYAEVDESQRQVPMLDLVERDVTTLSNLPGRVAGLLERELGLYTIRQQAEDELFIAAFKLVQEYHEQGFRMEAKHSRERLEDNSDSTQGNTPKKQKRR